MVQWLELDGPLDPCHPPTLCPRVRVSSNRTAGTKPKCEQTSFQTYSLRTEAEFQVIDESEEQKRKEKEQLRIGLNKHEQNLLMLVLTNLIHVTKTTDKDISSVFVFDCI